MSWNEIKILKGYFQQFYGYFPGDQLQSQICSCDMMGNYLFPHHEIRKQMRTLSSYTPICTAKNNLRTSVIKD